ncbi:hypothetical protein J7J47_23195, partial [Halomonas sp. ISL-60]|nr:hypothetical protein [Halomonas sp. ISL-60]
AARYWQARIHPNHLIPSLAPYFPLISVTASGFVQFQSASNYMLALTQAGAFYPSEAVLSEGAMTESLFGFMHDRLTSLAVTLAAEPKTGQAAALAMCVTYREQLMGDDSQRRDKAVRDMVKVNAELARFKVEVSGESPAHNIA